MTVTTGNDESWKLERRLTSACLSIAVTLIGFFGYRWMDQLEGRQARFETSESKVIRLETQMIALQQSQGEFKDDLRHLNDKLDRVLEILRKEK